MTINNQNCALIKIKIDGDHEQARLVRNRISELFQCQSVSTIYRRHSTTNASYYVNLYVPKE